jgi:hypothetical protein
MTPTLPLALPTTSTFEEWSDLGRMILTATRKLDWLRGDWLIDGSTRYGDKARDMAVSIFRADVDRFAPIVDTCRRFPESERHPALTFGHHLAVMAVSDDAEAHTILARAERDRMTVAAVKAHVRVSTDRQVTMLPDDDPTDTGARRIWQAWNRESRASRDEALAMMMEAQLGMIEI